MIIVLYDYNYNDSLRGSPPTRLASSVSSLDETYSEDQAVLNSG